MEPGEVENMLTAQPDVEAAHVTMEHHPATQEAQLVAHVTPSPCDSQALMRACKQQLPRHMVPSLFMAVSSLPQLPTGKVDAGGLPAPDWSQQDVAATPKGPRSDLEARVLSVMKDVLHSDAFGIHSDFFSLGGSSLLAHAVASGVSRATGVDVKAAAMFQDPTAASLSAHVAKSLDTLSASTAPVADNVQAAPYSEAERSAGVPCSLNQEQMFLAHDQLAAKHTYNVPMAVVLAEALDPAVLQAALLLLQERHDALRTGFCAASDGRPLQCVQPVRNAAPLGLSQAQVKFETGLSAHTLLRESAQAPFDLSSPPLLRALLLEVSLLFDLGI